LWLAARPPSQAPNESYPQIFAQTKGVVEKSSISVENSLNVPRFVMCNIQAVFIAQNQIQSACRWLIFFTFVLANT
jgi:hypothetical protein